MFGTPPSDDSPRSRRSGANPFITSAAPVSPAPRQVRVARRAQPAAAPAAPLPADDLPVQVVPVRRLLSLTIGGFAALLTVGLIMGAQTSGVAQRLPYAIVVFGAQMLYVFATTMALRPPGGKVVVAVGLLSAFAADYMANSPNEATIGPLGIVAAGGLVLGVLGQFTLREGRVRVTESLGATTMIVVGVVSFATLLVLVRLPLGTQSITVCLASCGVALSVARFTDVLAPFPRLAPQVARGAVGIVLGTMIGTGVAGYVGSYMVGFTPGSAAAVGAAAAAAAVLADLTIGFAEAGRELAGDPPTMWLARHMQGPLAGFGLAAPVAYLVTNLIWQAQ
ncbi:MAG TPA: hypothetical protein VFC19_35260 [Candidatus Limnocylindrales bacterium]|nr:hypothetical protein [Candidatus Limnocylindrales bacterium]